MKKFIYILGLLFLVLVNFSCVEKVTDIEFKDQNKISIYDYIVQHGDRYSSFLQIINKGGIDKILTAYNPEADGYTLFLPTNMAVEKFIQNSNGKFSSLNDLLSDTEYVYEMCRYHVLQKKYKSDDFPFGAFDQLTLSEDQLTVSNIITADSAYSSINNQAPVVFKNIETSNGYIHIIDYPLEPIVYTTYQWLEQTQGYSIFKKAVDTTGFRNLLSRISDFEVPGADPFTLLLEHDSIFNKRGIFTIQDLINIISPANNDFSNTSNPLFNFVGYHILSQSLFINNFENRTSNYNTYSDIPVLISDLELEMYIAINKGKQVFDTIVNGIDTTKIDYIGFIYDASNTLTQSGVIHFIDQILTQKSPNIATQWYHFHEQEAYFRYLNQVPGEYKLEGEDSLYLNNTKYTGTDLIYVTGDNTSKAWDRSYIKIGGYFTFKYTIPKILQGTYKLRLRADSYKADNAIVQVYVDGKVLGGLIDLTTGGSSEDPFNNKSVGNVTFTKYEQHTVEIKALVEGNLIMDCLFLDTNLTN